MNKIMTYILLSLFFITTNQVSGQYDYFYGQRNILSFHINANPRLIPLADNDHSNSVYSENTYYSNKGSRYGTYYTKNKKNGQQKVKKQNANIQYNMFIGRIFKKRILWGLDMSYQSHNLTFLHKDIAFSNLKTTPLFHVVEAQISFGIFLGKGLSPGKHLIQFQAGPQLYFLNTFKEYTNYNGETYDDLNNYMKMYNKPYTFMRFSANYTRRILLTESLSLDIGITSNFGLFGVLSPYSIINQEAGIVTKRNYVNERLGFETYRNILFLSTGISYAF